MHSKKDFFGASRLGRLSEIIFADVFSCLYAAPGVHGVCGAQFHCPPSLLATTIMVTHCTTSLRCGAEGTSAILSKRRI